jgi:hypothetical protein
MKLKKTNSKKEKAKQNENNTTFDKNPTSSKSLTENDGDQVEEENIDYEDFESDEEPEDDEDTQKDDMK